MTACVADICRSNELPVGLLPPTMEDMAPHYVETPPYAPPYGGVQPYPDRPEWPERGPRRRYTMLAIATFGVFLLMSVTGAAAFIAGRASMHVESQNSTTATEIDPLPRPYTLSDITWCREYSSANKRVLDQQEAAQWPKAMVARDVPASDWTPAEAATNREFSNTLEAGLSAPIARLKDSAQNSVLKLLMADQLQSQSELLTKIRSGVYQPADYSLYRSASASVIALDDICGEITRS